MSFHHSHSRHIDRNRILLAFALTFGFMLAEFIGGHLFNSVALQADAGHMANDSLSLSLTLFALNTTHTRLAQYLSVINGASLLLVAGYVIVEAVQRLHQPISIVIVPMLSISIIGLVVNILVARIMWHADLDNLNIRAAYWHVLADLMGSVAAIVAGVGNYFLGWIWLDAVMALLVGLLVLKNGWSITRMALVQLKLT